MFTLAILIGVYSCLIFGLGLSGMLVPVNIFWLTLEFLVLSVWFFPRPKLSVKLSRLSWFFVALLIIQSLINLIGALGPELGFDALWYHLTIPRIWLAAHKIFFISDGRYYYSAMPKLIEMLYVSGLSFGNEIVPKLIHFGFGILTLAVIYKLARKWLSQEYSLLAAVIFYGNLVVGWQSITAYIDLGRTFFEVLALYYLVEKRFMKSGLILGLAIASKLIAIGSAPMFIAIIFWQTRSWKTIFNFFLVSVLPVLPWLIFAYISTGNPIYPIFSGYDLYSVRHASDIVTIFLRSADPLSPMYLIVLPFILLNRKKIPNTLIAYSVLALIVWWVTPRTGGGRFILPYLPAFSVMSALAICHTKDLLIRKVLVCLVIFVSVFSIIYRGVANWKFIPVITKQQTKSDFLEKNLNHEFGGNYFYQLDPFGK